MMKRRIFLASATLSLGLLAGLVPGFGSPAPAATAIQPGSRITSGGSGCTMNFIYEEVRERPARRGQRQVVLAEPKLYAGTAGHCVSGVGARVSNDSGAFGTVAFRVLDDNDDVAFIEIDEAKRSSANPKMLGFDGPNGVISGREAKPGDRVNIYGNGLIVGETELTRPRSGTLTRSDSQHYGATLPVIFGDSGGPVLHENGAALGIIAHLVVSGNLTTLDGNTVERALELASASGLNLKVVPG